MNLITRNQSALDSKTDSPDDVCWTDEDEIQYWQSLTPEEQEASRAALARSLADADAGRVSDADEAFARIRLHYQ